MMKLFYALFFSVLFFGCAKQSVQPPRTSLSPAAIKLASDMDDRLKDHIHLPLLPLTYSADRYFNTQPSQLNPDALKGKVVLLDIWDYSCINCIRTLPYIKSWAEKYKDKGLVVIGIHTPEFEFGKSAENLKAAIAKFGIIYPNIADNESEIWDTLHNEYWPAKYLYDKDGILRTVHTGEGQYQEFEAFMQKILLERDSTIALPALTEVVRSSDKPGSVCYRVTPETYIGSSRNKAGNTEKISEGSDVNFKPVSKLADDKLYFAGSWKFGKEFGIPAGGGASSLAINYQAKEVNLVIRPQSATDFKVLIEQDGKPVAKEDRGTDIIEEGGKTFLQPKETRMYNLINNSKVGRFMLKLSSNSSAFGAYAFTFTSDCMAE